MKNRFGIDWSNIQGTQFWARPKLGRRVFFSHMASAVGGYFLLPAAAERVAQAAVATKGTAKNVIFVLMAGGPSHTDTFDLKEGAWTPSFMAPTSYGDVRFPQGLMPTLADQIDNIALVRSIQAWVPVHGLSSAWWQIGRNPLSAMGKVAPHVGAVVGMELAPQQPDALLPPFLSLNAASGPDCGYFPPKYSPFYVSPNGGGLGNTTHRDGQPRFNSRYAMLADIDAANRAGSPQGGAFDEMVTWNSAAHKIMYNTQVDAVFNFSATERARYGNTGFGNACITARNLFKARLGTRFVQITIGGWDNHVNIYQPNAVLQANMKQFDQGLGTLIADLKADGTLNDTLIVCLGEFGRTVGPLNATSGRDHFVQMAAMFAGGGVKGRQAVGATENLGATIKDPGWNRNREIRTEDIEATIYSALGIDWTTVRRDDPLGRGFEYVPFALSRDLYGPVHELWG